MKINYYNINKLIFIKFEQFKLIIPFLPIFTDLIESISEPFSSSLNQNAQMVLNKLKYQILYILYIYFFSLDLLLFFLESLIIFYPHICLQNQYILLPVHDILNFKNIHKFSL
jgi:hypothetical protein